mgnify:CR=1 FL=1
MSFRESDATEPRYHSSFINKPVSILQLNNQLSHLEAPRPTYATVHDMVPAPVRASHDEVYDPQHPDADWSGLVKRDQYTRKHGKGHISQKIGIIHSDNGIISKEEKKEFPRKRREHTPLYEDNHILGGVLDPDFDQYMTDMKRGNNGMKTNTSQLNLKKQQMMKKDCHFNNSNSNSNNIENQRNHGQPNATPRNGQGVFPPQQSITSHNPNTNTTNNTNKVSSIGMSKSLLSNIGDMLVKDIPSGQFPGEKQQQTHANYNPRSMYNVVRK